MYSRWLRNSFIYLLILVAVIAIVFSFFAPGGNTPSKDIGTVIADAKAGKVQSIEVSGDSLTVFEGGQKYHSRKENSGTITELLQQNQIALGGANGVDVKVKEPSQLLICGGSLTVY
jgi:cell division protease FtsH